MGNIPRKLKSANSSHSCCAKAIFRRRIGHRLGATITIAEILVIGNDPLLSYCPTVAYRSRGKVGLALILSIGTGE